MKKYLLLPALLISLPVFSACPIESGETVCTLPNFREQVQPIFDNTNYPKSVNPAQNLQPLKREDPINQMRGPNNQLNYNSGCQFGVCLQDPKESRLQNDFMGN